MKIFWILNGLYLTEYVSLVFSPYCLVYMPPCYWVPSVIRQKVIAISPAKKLIWLYSSVTRNLWGTIVYNWFLDFVVGSAHFQLIYIFLKKYRFILEAWNEKVHFWHKLSQVLTVIAIAFRLFPKNFHALSHRLVTGYLQLLTFDYISLLSKYILYRIGALEWR